jgi:acyl-CoA thioester hydrolase
MSTHCWSVRVYYEDTDASGVAYHANYLRWFERARTEWLRSKGFGQRSLAENEDAAFTVSQLNLRYRQPARLDDLLSIETRITRRRGASLDFAQRALCGERLLCEAEVRVACVNSVSFKPQSLPVSFPKDEPS